MKDNKLSVTGGNRVDIKKIRKLRELLEKADIDPVAYDKEEHRYLLPEGKDIKSLQAAKPEEQVKKKAERDVAKMQGKDATDSVDTETLTTRISENQKTLLALPQNEDGCPVDIKHAKRLSEKLVEDSQALEALEAAQRSSARRAQSAPESS